MNKSTSRVAHEQNKITHSEIWTGQNATLLKSSDRIVSGCLSPAKSAGRRGGVTLPDWSGNVVPRRVNEKSGVKLARLSTPNTVSGGGGLDNMSEGGVGVEI